MNVLAHLAHEKTGVDCIILPTRILGNTWTTAGAKRGKTCSPWSIFMSALTNIQLVCLRPVAVIKAFVLFCPFHQRVSDSRTRTTTSTRFSHRTRVSARKPALFWREKRDTVVILVRGFAKMSSCQNKSTTR